MQVTDVMESTVYGFKERSRAPETSDADWYVDTLCEGTQELVNIIQFIERHYGHVVSAQTSDENLSCDRNGGDVRLWVAETRRVGVTD